MQDTLYFFQEAKSVTDKLANLSLEEITTFENELKVMKKEKKKS